MGKAMMSLELNGRVYSSKLYIKLIDYTTLWVSRWKTHISISISPTAREILLIDILRI